jgi:hypothetical protein
MYPLHIQRVTEMPDSTGRTMAWNSVFSIGTQLQGELIFPEVLDLVAPLPGPGGVAFAISMRKSAATMPTTGSRMRCVRSSRC